MSPALLTTPPDGIQAAVDAGRQMASISERQADICGIPAILAPPGATVHILKQAVDIADERAQRPRRLKGTASFVEVLSFIAHVNRFKDAQSLIFADPEKMTFTAVLNYHEGDISTAPAERAPRWADHRSLYACPLSQEWKTWTKSHNEKMGQTEFAAYLEDNLEDVIVPSDENGKPVPGWPAGAALLEAARSLELNSAAKFKSAVNLSSGEVQFRYETEHKGAGEMSLPREFMIAIPIFRGSDKGVMIKVKLRYRLNEARLTFWYELHRADKVKDAAFNETRKAIEAATGLPILAGSPES